MSQTRRVLNHKLFQLERKLKDTELALQKAESALQKAAAARLLSQVKATVNMPDVDPPDGCVFIKDYAENEGMLAFLLENEIVEQGVGFKIPTGHVQVPLVRKGKNWPT